MIKSASADHERARELLQLVCPEQAELIPQCSPPSSPATSPLRGQKRRREEPVQELPSKRVRRTVNR